MSDTSVVSSVSIVQTPSAPATSEEQKAILKKIKPNDFEMQDALKLSALLQANLAKPNVLTREEFRKFEVLYRKPPVITDVNEKIRHEDMIQKLTDEYRVKIDYFRETHIIHSRADPRIIAVLPPIFIPIRSIQPGEAGDKAVLGNYRDRNHQMPKVKSEAQGRMTNALLEEQRSPDQIRDIANERRRSHSLLDMFRLAKEGRLVITGATDRVTPGVTPAAASVDQNKPTAQNIVDMSGGEEDFG